MIDLEKERETFNEQFGVPEPHECFLAKANPAQDSFALKCNWLGWKACAESKQAEIDSLKAQLAKIESGEFVVVPKSKLNTCYWDEANNGVGYYELFDTLEEAKKAAAHYKATIEAAQENSHE